MLILLSLLQPALACDPSPWEVIESWPSETVSAPPQAAPLVYIASAGGTTFELLDAEDGAVAGSSEVLADDFFASILRFTPDSDLAPGDYELTANAPFGEGKTVLSFTVSADATTVPAVAPVNLAITYVAYDEEGDSCDEPPLHDVVLDWEWPDVLQAQSLAYSVHLVDPVDEVTFTDTVYLHQGDDVMSTDSRSLSLPLPEGASFADRFCLAIAVWGDNASDDAVSDTICYDPVGTGPGPGPGDEGEDTGCACSSTGSPLSLVPLAGLLGLLWARRRRD